MFSFLFPGSALYNYDSSLVKSSMLLWRAFVYTRIEISKAATF